MLRFWASKLDFWRKSRTKASFLSFKASFLKEVSDKSFVFELQSLIFEGSPAEMLGFWASKLQFWRKSRRKKSFLILKASFSKEAPQKSIVFELQSFIFEGSLAEKLRFWSSKLHFWSKPRRKVAFLIFKASFLKEVSQKSFVFELQSFKFDIPNQTTTNSLESQVNWHPLNLKSLDNQITWISIQSTTKSFEPQIIWQPNHLNLKSFDIQINWIPNQLRTKIIGISNHLTTESLEPQIRWQPNHLNLKSDDNQITWIPNQMTTKPFDSQFTWIWHQLTFEHWTPHTSSYRFIMVGNFRHRLVRSICYNLCFTLLLLPKVQKATRISSLCRPTTSQLQRICPKSNGAKCWRFGPAEFTLAIPTRWIDSGEVEALHGILPRKCRWTELVSGSPKESWLLLEFRKAIDVTGAHWLQCQDATLFLVVFPGIF